jgi:AraC family transcriptional regulator, transcriptional activator FtrA
MTSASGRNDTEHQKTAMHAIATIAYDSVNPIELAVAAAAIDPSLLVVRQDYGADIAAAVARRMVVPLHRDGSQAQYIKMPLPVPGEEEPFVTTLAWIAALLDSHH